MGLVLTDFRGTLPGVANYDLPSNAASEAIDCEFGGTVRAARFYSTTDGTLWPNKVYGQWFNSDTPNGILPSPMADDSIDRMYRVSAGKLQRALLSSAGSWVDVGIESPSITMTITVKQPIIGFIGVGTIEEPITDIPKGELGMSRAYVYTVCRIVGDNNGNQVVEEGPPSVPVIVNNVYSNSVIKIQFASNVPSGYTFAIYRAQAGMYLYVGDCIAGANTFEDNIPDAALGEECPSMDWLPPPTLQGVISTGYGFFVGWNQNRVYCSELYLPHAWPAGYSYTTKYNIRRCIATHNGILAITDNGNYFIAGSSPTGLNLVEMPTFHPCIGDMTAVDMGDGVVYAAPNGLALVTTSGSQLLTEGAIDPTWWAAQNFTNAVAYRAGESYVLAVGGETLVFNLRDKTIHTSTGMPTKATFDQATGDLQTSSGSISVSSLAPSYVWQSKVFEFNRMPTFGWTQCVASAYPVTVQWKLWKSLTDTNEAATTYSVTYTDHHPKRFPAGVFHRVRARIVSSNPVSKLVLTNNRDELEFIG